MTEIQRANLGARRQAIRLGICVAAIGVVAILASQNLFPVLEAWVIRDPAKQTSRSLVVLGVFCTLLVSPPVGFGVYLWRFGGMVIRFKRFPPPDVAVIRDTPILENHAAYQRGRLLRMLAVFLLAAVCCLLTLMGVLAHSLGAGLAQARATRQRDPVASGQLSSDVYERECHGRGRC